MSWLLFPLALALVLLAGIRVLSGRWPATTPARDTDALRRWQAAQRTGFWKFAIRGPILSTAACLTAIALTRAWRSSGSLTLSIEDSVWIVGLSLLFGIVAARVRWAMLDSAASEARARQPHVTKAPNQNPPEPPPPSIRPARDHP